MLFFALVLAGSLFLLPVALLVLVFLAAWADYLLGGGPAATTTQSNADFHSPSRGTVAPGVLLETE